MRTVTVRIEPDKQGRQCWWVRVHGPGVKNRLGKVTGRASRRFATEAEARAAGEKVKAAAVLGVDYTPRAVADVPTPPDVPTFRDVAEEALTRHAALNNLSAPTLANHRGYLKRHLLPAFGAKPMTAETFDLDTIEDFIMAQRKVMEDISLKTSLPTLGIIFDRAVRRKLLPFNPLRGAGRLWKPKPSEPVNPFTPETTRAILHAAAAVDHDFGVLLQVMFQAGGLRSGEALGLRRCDIDCDRAEVRIARSLSNGVLGQTKTRTERVVSLLHPVSEPRRIWRPEEAGPETRRVVEGLRNLKVVPADPEGRLFDMGRSVFERLWRRTLKKAGVAYRKPHTARHTFASVMLSRGAPLLKVQKAGGWASGQVLLKTYAKWIEEADRVATSEASSGASSGTGSRDTAVVARG